MRRTKNITAIILKKRDFMENDMILTLLDDQGVRQETIVKGVRSGRSRRRNHIELMNQVRGTIYEGKTHNYLQSVTCVNSFPRLKTKLELIMRMNLIMEIVEKTVLENDAHPEIYTLLQDTLTSCNSADAHPFLPEIALVKLAHHLGFLPNFKSCSHCHSALDSDDALWDANAGTVQCQSCGLDSHSHLPLKYRKALDFFQRAARPDCEKVILQDEEQFLMRQFIPKLFTLQMDRPLKSLALL